MGEKKEGKAKKPGFVKAYEKDKKREQKDLEKQLSIRERLMRRVGQMVVEVSFKDDLGEFKVKCRLLTEQEQRKLVGLGAEITKIDTPKQYDETMGQLKRFLAYPSGICLDSSLNLEFWKKGNYAMQDMLKIVTEVSKQTGQVVEETRSFRKE